MSGRHLELAEGEGEVPGRYRVRDEDGCLLVVSAADVVGDADDPST